MKERIQEKARELFFRYGFRTVKMDDISKELGISKKTVYLYFTDKVDLIKNIIEAEIKQIQDNILQNDREANAIDALLESMHTFEHCMESLNPDILLELEKLYPVIYTKFQGFKKDFLLQAIRNNLIRGIDEGLYRPEIDVDIISRFRLESSLVVFDTTAFPYGKYSLLAIAKEIFLMYAFGIASTKGKKLLENHLKEQESVFEKTER